MKSGVDAGRGFLRILFPEMKIPYNCFSKAYSGSSVLHTIVLFFGCSLALWAGPLEVAPPAQAPYQAGKSLEHDVPTTDLKESEDKWKFRLLSYLWAQNLDGTTGFNGLEAPLEVGFGTILENLDFAYMGAIEVSYAERFGFLADIEYAEISASASEPVLGIQSLDIEHEEYFITLLLWYRLINTERFDLDLFGGVRFAGLEDTYSIRPNDDGIRDIARFAGGRFEDEVRDAVRGAIPGLQQELGNAVRGRVADFIEGTGLSPEEIREIIENIDDEQRELIRATVEAQREAAINELTRRAERALAKARKDLEEAIEKELKKALRRSITESEQWVDPIIGIRARLQLLDWLTLVALADIGGFGAGSEFTYELVAALEAKLSDHVFTHLGYRFRSIDYDQDDYIYRVETSGIYAGLGIEF